MVVDDGTMKYDLLLGRQFFQKADLTLIYRNGSYTFEINNEEFVHSIFAIDVTEKRCVQDEIKNLDADLPLAIKEKLFDTFNYVDKLEVEMVKEMISVLKSI